VAASQILTLYTTSLIYIYLDKLQAWVFRGKGGTNGLRKSGAKPAE